MRSSPPNVLSIAGSDPSGGAGIQADLKSFSANGAYGMAVITALTAQNTKGVTGIETMPPAFVAAQIEAVFSDIRVDAVKIGMIANASIATAIADQLRRWQPRWIVLDPVMVAKGGARLLAPDAVHALTQHLLPLADVITPNLAEAAALAARPIISKANEMPALAESLVQRGARAVLLKGGHLETENSPDLLLADGRITWFEGPRFRTANTHGTGCTLSSALATWLAHGDDLVTAARHAKAFVAGAIEAADRLDVGTGHGPTHHFHALWPRS